MLTAVKGVVRDNTIVVENESLQNFNGYDAIITFIRKPQDNSIQKKDSTRIVYELLGSIPYDSLTLDDYREERINKYEVTN